MRLGIRFALASARSVIFPIIVALSSTLIPTQAGANFRPPPVADVNTLYEIGIGYLQQRRYRDAEPYLEQLINHPDFSRFQFQYAIQIRSGYETTLLHQGKNLQTKASLEDTLELIRAANKRDSFEQAYTLLNYGEVHFRIHENDEAVALTKQSIQVASGLGAQYGQFVQFAEGNVRQFTNEQWHSGKLPMDLSDFFSQCESLSAAQAFTFARDKMDAYLEVGKDYLAQGVMADIFQTAVVAGLARKMGSNQQRTVFIPNENLLSDWCVVIHQDGVIQNAVISSDD